MLHPGGLAFFRCFAQPPAGRSVDALFAGLAQGAAVPFDLFRWQFAIAVQGERRG